MTLYFNVTDAIDDAPNHGITRTERRLATALAGFGDVAFVVVGGGHLWRVDETLVTAGSVSANEGDTPTVERFGVTPAPAPRTAASGRDVRRVARSLGASIRALSNRADRGPMPADRVKVRPDDVFVSAGLDWVRDVPTVADRVVFGAGGHFIAFCYDTIPIDHPEWLFPPDPRRFAEHFDRITRAADRVVAISECTKRDFCRLYPRYRTDRVPVIQLGADAAVEFDHHHREFAARLFDGEPFAIYTATVDRRKNHTVLYRAVRELARRGVPANLLFVGRLGNGTTDLVDAIRHDRSVAGRIAHVTNCDDRYLAACYERASFAVYPSLYEGWGLGVTEAMAHGKACVVASGSSLGEAGLGVCRELHPLKTLDWADAITEYFAAPPEVPARSIPTWEHAAGAVWDLAQSVVGGGAS